MNHRARHRPRGVPGVLRNLLLAALLIFPSWSRAAGSSPYMGMGGVFHLGSVDRPLALSVFENPDITGVVVRFDWNTVEPSPGEFDWSFVDGEIAKAVAQGKYASLQPMRTPAWILEMGTRQYLSRERNPESPDFGKASRKVLPWDSLYIVRYEKFLEDMAARYAANPTVAYVNAIGVAFSRGLPDSVVAPGPDSANLPFWTTYGYDADTLAAVMNRMTDRYMELFPSTPLWNSVDYVTFEPRASGKPRNHLAGLVVAYGRETYPDRFGLFREDISACTPSVDIPSGSQWALMQQNPCATGAQALWSVQDGPTRMNKCGILPNTPSVVLDSTVGKGIDFGMRYVEIYGADLSDSTLKATIHNAQSRLQEKSRTCSLPPTRLLPQPLRASRDLRLIRDGSHLVVASAPGSRSPTRRFRITDLHGSILSQGTLAGISSVRLPHLPRGTYLLYEIGPTPGGATPFVIP